jgi:hypothetical protein
MSEIAGYAVTITGGLYAYGDTKVAAMNAFRRQIAGASPTMQGSMLRKVYLEPLSLDDASAAAECLDAPQIF